MPAVIVFSGLAVQQPLESVVFPMFRRDHGAEVDATFEPTTLLVERLRAGVRADVVVGVKPALLEIAREGLLVGGSVEDLFRTGLGLAVAPGVPVPRIRTVDEFVAVLVGARSVAYSQAGASGIYFSQLLERLGIADAVTSRATVIPSGYTATCLLDGRADVAIQQLSELRFVPGVQVAGPFPPDVQSSTEFVVAEAVSGTESRDVGLVRGLRAILRSPESLAAYREAGLEPAV